MKTTVYRSDFHDAFIRADRKENFSYSGRDILFDYLEQYEEDSGEEIELDVIALCCDYSEESPEDIAANYNIDLDGIDQEDDDAVKEAVMEYLNDNTMVVGETNKGTIVYQVF